MDTNTAPSAHTGNQHLYRRHRPEETALYPVIALHLPTFLARVHARDTQLPRFVTDEFMTICAADVLSMASCE